MSNGLEIKSKDDIARIYRDNPDVIVIFMAENLMDVKRDINEIKNQCACRYDQCQKDLKIDHDLLVGKIKANKFKNFLLQFPGGVVGGIIVSYLVMKLWIETKLNIKLPDID